MKIVYTVDDGYIMPGTQTLELDLEEFEGCITRNDVETLLYDMIQEDFEQKVSWVVEDIETKIDEIFSQICTKK